MGPGIILQYIYKYGSMIRSSATGRQLLQLGSGGLATSQVIDGLDDFFGTEGPGHNVATGDSKKMKEAIAWLMSFVPKDRTGPWTIKGVDYDPQYLTIKLGTDRVWLSHKYYSKKSMDAKYNIGFKNGQRSAKSEMVKDNQIAKGVK